MRAHQVIDAHMHVFPTREAAQKAEVLTGFCQYDGTPQDTVRALEAGGISKGVVLVQIPVAYMMEAGLSRLPEGLSDEERQKAEKDLKQRMIDRVQRRNTWVCQVAKEYPQLIPMITMDPIMGPELMKKETIDKVKNHGAKGMKLHPPIGRYYPNDRRMWPAYEACVELDVPIIFHCGPDPLFDGASLLPRPVEYSRPRHFVEILAAFPKLKVVLAHMGVGPDKRWSHLYSTYLEEAISVGKECPTLLFDTCTALDPRWSDVVPGDWVRMIREIGPERVMWGSDYPALDPAEDLQSFLSLDLADQERHLILNENARRVFKLS